MGELLEKVEPLILAIPAISYTGLSSQVSQSGRFDSAGNPITKRGSPYLRRAIWLAASRAYRCDLKLKAFLRQETPRGKAS